MEQRSTRAALCSRRAVGGWLARRGGTKQRALLGGEPRLHTTVGSRTDGSNSESSRGAALDHSPRPSGAAVLVWAGKGDQYLGQAW
jgi:hypothetical protein